jgi:hypothetical protein
MSSGDKELRAPLVKLLRAQYPDARLVQEWSVGQSRVDVALIVNGELHGYEIKSARDSLARLKQQVNDYSRVFNRCTLVCDWKHAHKARTIVPAWWGVWQMGDIFDDGRMCLDRFDGFRNHCFDATALCWLLWHREMRALLQRRCLDWRTYRGKRQMVECIAERVPASELQRAVVDCLLARDTWKDLNDGARGSHWA